MVSTWTGEIGDGCRSRTSRWGGGGADLQHERFSMKMCAKMKELRSVGGGAGGGSCIRQWEIIFQLSRGIYIRLEKSGNFTQNTGKNQE